MFIHQSADFAQLIAIVARESGISSALIEKDYWVTHTLWGIQAVGLEVWFKGGTSLSKGFGLIQRFSEDLDLKIEPGSAPGLPEVKNWKSTNKGPTQVRRAYFAGLEAALRIPDVRVERDTTRIDQRARSADYLGYYPGIHLDSLAPALSPFVRLEVGHARFVPHLQLSLSSFVHDYLDREGILADFTENRPQSVRCIHPLVTLFEKLEALSRRYAQAPFEPDAFVRHYEDAAQIVRSVTDLPPIDQTPTELLQELLEAKDIRTAPSSESEALILEDPTKREALEAAHQRIAPMFWGQRIGLDEACSILRHWLERLG